MDPHAPDPADAQLDTLLRSRRPEPDAAWVRSTESELFGVPRAARARTRRWPSPVLRMGAGLAVGLAAVVLVLALAGTSLLGKGDQGARAGEKCRMVSVTRVQRVPFIARSRRGGLEIRYTRRPVERVVRRCS